MYGTSAHEWNTWIAEIHDNEVTGVSEYGEQIASKVYPNPVKDYLVFSGNLKIKSIELISYSGQKLSELTLTNGKVNLSNLKKGFYILKLDTDKGEKTIKIIKD